MDPTPQKSKKATLVEDLRCFKNIRVLCVAALLCAVSFALAYFAKAIQGSSPLRFTIEGLPIVLSGLLFGPAVGALVGIGADLLSCAMTAMAVNPLITVGAAAIGIVSGLFSHYLWTKEGLARIVLSDLFSHLIGSMVIKSVALHAYGYPWPTLALRIPIYLAVIVIESALLHLLLRSSILQKEISRIRK